MHTRIPFDLVTADGIATFRRFIERAADLVVSYGGSFSGEHGDGQARGELPPKMFGPELVDAFGQFKAIFDPANRMNPRQGGTKVVGLEPSCTAVFRSDARELMPGNRDVERLGEQTVTLAELLTHHTEGWQPPRVGGQAIAQTHCHQHAIMGYDEDKALLRAAGIDVDVLDAGCCGLAGNFGFEAGHYDVSMACGERALLPAVRGAPQETLVLADGFSCRTQIEQGNTGRTAVHLAEVLAAGLRGEPVRPGRPAPPGTADYLRLAGLAAAAATVVVVAAVAAVVRRRRRR